MGLWLYEPDKYVPVGTWRNWIPGDLSVDLQHENKVSSLYGKKYGGYLNIFIAEFISRGSMDCSHF